MRYIAKFDEIASLERFAEISDVEVVDVLQHLNMLVFDFDEETAIYTRDELETYEGVVRIMRDNVMSLDYKSTKQDVSVVKTDVQALETTLFGQLDGTTEYFTHLELLSSLDYNLATETHDYTPTYTGNNVDCFVIDTGVNSNNWFLNGKVFKTNFGLNLDQTNNEDNDGHGTTSALIIAGKWMGVAKDSKIYTLKVLDSTGSGTTSNITSAINNVIAFHNAKTDDYPSIINLSLGQPVTPANPDIEEDETNPGGVHDNFYNDAIKEAVANGIHVVLAAGNGFSETVTIEHDPNGQDHESETLYHGPMLSKYTNGYLNLPPAIAGNVDVGQGDCIVVGAVDSNSTKLQSSTDPGHLSWFSNYGDGNTINATGAQMILPQYTSNSDPETHGVPWKAFSGTSFATPVVTGLLALHLEKNPTATPAEAKEWMISVANRDKIPNLMKYEEYENQTIAIAWDTDTLQLASYNIAWSETLETNDIIQFELEASSPPSDGMGLIDSINQINDGWWDVESIENGILEVSPRILADYDDIVAATYVENGAKFKFAKVNGNHEFTDGVKAWQTTSSENRLHDGATDTDIYVTNVDMTENLLAFNPYQAYAVDWDGVSELNMTTMFDDSPLLRVGIKTGRGEQPLSPKFSLASGALPTGVTLHENGTFSKSAEFESSSGSYGNVIIKVTTDYSEDFVKDMSVLDSEYSAYDFENVMQKDSLVFYGACENTVTQFDLPTHKSAIKEVYQIDDTRAIVWRNDIPDAITQPFSKLIPGHIYYIKLVDGQQVSIPNCSSFGEGEHLVPFVDCV